MRKERRSTEESYLQLSTLERERISNNPAIDVDGRHLLILRLKERLRGRGSSFDANT